MSMPSPAHLHKGDLYTVHSFLTFIKRLTNMCLQSIQYHFVDWTKPATTSLRLGTVADLARNKSELVAENALLRQQLIILSRQVKRPVFKKTDRMLLVLLARAVQTWKQALFIIQPETLLRWHRQGFRLFWKYKSRATAPKPKIAAETVALIKEMARNNRLWGAERIRGELLKLGLHVCKRTIQKYMRYARSPRRGGQNWTTFLQNHAKDMWACDFLQVTDLFFRSLFPSSLSICTLGESFMWVSHDLLPTPGPPVPLREATPYGQSPNYLMRDRDNKFGPRFARVAATSGIKMLTTPYHAPRANAICERFLGSVRRECLDHLFILQEKQLDRVLQAYIQYFNQARPHQGIKQQIPEQYSEPVQPDHDGGKILSFPVLGGLHHDYHRSA